MFNSFSCSSRCSNCLGVMNLPSLPARGSCLFQSLSLQQGGVICISSRGCGVLKSHRVAPMAVESIPATAMISPADALSTNTHSKPSFNKQLSYSSLCFFSLSISTTGSFVLTVPLFIFPIKYLPK